MVYSYCRRRLPSDYFGPQKSDQAAICRRFETEKRRRIKLHYIILYMPRTASRKRAWLLQVIAAAEWRFAAGILSHSTDHVGLDICICYNVVIHVMFPATLFRISGKINYKYFLSIFYFSRPACP